MSNVKTLDPAAGTGTLVMTAHGLVPQHILSAYIQTEAERLRKQEPSEPEYV